MSAFSLFKINSYLTKIVIGNKIAFIAPKKPQNLVGVIYVELIRCAS
jgi:hypothetical protein